MNNKFRSVILIGLCSVTLPLKAAFDERYRLTVGYSNTDFDSRLSINSRDDSIDEEIDFEDILGLENNLQFAWLSGSWRMAERHRLAVLYLPIKRSSSLTTQDDFNLGGNIIKTGASVDTEVATHTFDIEYIYSVYKKPDLEIGITGGLYWMNSRVEILTAGEIIIDGADEPEFRQSYKTSQRLIAPLPLFGVDAAYEIQPQWHARASARYLDVKIGEIEGRILSLNIATEYYFNNNLGAGVSFKYLDVNVVQNGVVLINSLRFQFDDVQAYLVLKY